MSAKSLSLTRSADAVRGGDQTRRRALKKSAGKSSLLVCSGGTPSQRISRRPTPAGPAPPPLTGSPSSRAEIGQGRGEVAVGFDHLQRVIAGKLPSGPAESSESQAVSATERLTSAMVLLPNRMDSSLRWFTRHRTLVWGCARVRQRRTSGRRVADATGRQAGRKPGQLDALDDPGAGRLSDPAAGRDGRLDGDVPGAPDETRWGRPVEVARSRPWSAAPEWRRYRRAGPPAGVARVSRRKCSSGRPATVVSARRVSSPLHLPGLSRPRDFGGNGGSRSRATTERSATSATSSGMNGRAISQIVARGPQQAAVAAADQPIGVGGNLARRGSAGGATASRTRLPARPRQRCRGRESSRRRSARSVASTEPRAVSVSISLWELSLKRAQWSRAAV